MSKGCSSALVLRSCEYTWFHIVSISFQLVTTPCSTGYDTFNNPLYSCAVLPMNVSFRTDDSSPIEPAIIRWYLGFPIIDGLYDRGLSSPAKPALMIPDPLSITTGWLYSSSMLSISFYFLLHAAFCCCCFPCCCAAMVLCGSLCCLCTDSRRGSQNVYFSMNALSSLTNNQKAELRNAFTLIDGESKDLLITKEDLVKLHKTLGLAVPSNKQLEAMINTNDPDSKGINFTQFLSIMAQNLVKLDDRTTIYNALKVFAEGHDVKEDLIIDVEVLKEACCSVQLGEIGSGDHRLSRNTFDELVKGFVKEQSDGKKLFLASNWLDAYVD